MSDQLQDILREINVRLANMEGMVTMLYQQAFPMAKAYEQYCDNYRANNPQQIPYKHDAERGK